MDDRDLAYHLATVRAQAARLAARLGADAGSAAPFLQAVAGLEDHILGPGDAAIAVGDSAMAIRPASQGSAEFDPTRLLKQAASQSAEFHQVLLDVPIGICILHGAAHRYTFTNPIYDQIVGRTDLVGKTVQQVFPEIADQGIYELLDQVYTSGTPLIVRERLIQLDRHGTGVREDVYFDLVYLPLREADGAVSGVVAYISDVSDRRALDEQRAHVLRLVQASHQAADDERQRLLMILHQAPAAICTLEGPEHIFTFANPRYEQLIGRQDLVGRTVRDVLPEVSGQGFFELLDRVRSTGIPFIGNEVPIQLARQSIDIPEQTFVNFIYAPLRDSTETITGIFVHAVDVTDLVAARQAAEAAVVLRDQFLSIAAHELKTPLTSMLGSIQVLQRRMHRTGETDERTNRTLTMIGAQGQRLTRLIDTLLDVARITMGHLTLDRAPLDLGTLVIRVIDEMRITLDRRTINVSLGSEPCVVLGDSLRLEQVIVNLVQNAVKYSPADAPIALTVGKTTSEAWMCVQDQGIGIPKADLAHLFERFYRVANAAGQTIPGMGIGLSVVYDIVTLHGGRIAVDSTEGQGSTFTVFMPLAQPAADR